MPVPNHRMAVPSKRAQICLNVCINFVASKNGSWSHANLENGAIVEKRDRFVRYFLSANGGYIDTALQGHRAMVTETV